MSRAERVALSVGRPSRRKNEPGIFPAAYMRSSTSMVSGKKSTPSRGWRLEVAVASTSVPPMLATTEPSACRASLPVWKAISAPPTTPATDVSGTLYNSSSGGRASQLPVVTPRADREVATDN